MAERERIFVGVPSGGNQINGAMVQYLLALSNLNLNKDVPFVFVIDVVNSHTPVEYARNMIVKRFLDSDCSRLWFLDDDMIPTTTTGHVLNIEGDIVGARTFAFDHRNEATGLDPGVKLCAFVQAPGSPWKYHAIIPQEGDPLVYDVDAVGTACTVIRREVLEDRRMHLRTKYTLPDGSKGDLRRERNEPGWTPAVFRFHRKPNGEGIMGEDIDFCRRAKRAGYAIRCHLGAEIGHFKRLDIDQTVEMALAGMARKEKAS